MIFFILMASIYLAAGFLVYGMRKAMYLSNCKCREYVGYTVEDERSVRILASFGIFGLMYFMLWSIDQAGNIFPNDKVFCFFMPRELWAPRAVRVKQEK